MAWYKGNKPTWERKHLGRILVEAMKGINEREAVSYGAAWRTSWTGIGVDPGLTAAQWNNISQYGCTWLNAMQTAISNLLDRSRVTFNWEPRWVDGSYNPYTLDALLTAAGGWDSWQAPTWDPTVTDLCIEQILKSLEKLTRARHILLINDNKSASKGWEPSPKEYVATPTIAHANCEAQAQSVQPQHAPSRHNIFASYFWDGYWHYDKHEQMQQLEYSAIPSDATARYLEARIEKLSSPSDFVNAGTWNFYKISAGLYGTPVWQDTGEALLGSPVVDPGADDWYIVVLSGHAALDFTESYFYWKSIPPTSTVFKDFVYYDEALPGKVAFSYAYICYLDTAPDWPMRACFDPVLTYK